MAGIGIGVGVGFGARNRLQKPPNYEDVIRQFIKRDDYTLLDEVAGRDATLLPRVSGFAVDGRVDVGVKTLNSSFVELECKLVITDETVSQQWFLDSKQAGSPTSEGIALNYYYATGGIAIRYKTENGAQTTYNSIDTININEVNSIKIRLDFDSQTITININNSERQVSMEGGQDSTITSRYAWLIANAFNIDAGLSNGSIWNVRIKDESQEILIPLPHTGVGFIPNGSDWDTVQLTVSGGVTEGFAEGGYLGDFEKGCVLRSGTYIPNKPNSQPAFPIVEGDTFISGTSFINATPFMVDMSRPNRSEAELFTGFTTLGDGWIDNGDGSYSIDGTQVATSNISKNGQLSIGQKYIIRELLDITNYASGIGWSGSSFSDPFAPNRIFNQNRIKVGALTANSTTLTAFATSGAVMTFKDISIKLATPEILFFDKSDVTIWKDSVRSSDFYDSNNPFLWHSSELTQQFIYDNIQDAEKYKWWIRLINNQYKDLFLYNTALTGSDITKAENYTGVPEA